MSRWGEEERKKEMREDGSKLPVEISLDLMFCSNGQPCGSRPCVRVALEIGWTSWA